MVKITSFYQADLKKPLICNAQIQLNVKNKYSGICIYNSKARLDYPNPT